MCTHLNVPNATTNSALLRNYTALIHHSWSAVISFLPFNLILSFLKTFCTCEILAFVRRISWRTSGVIHSSSDQRCSTYMYIRALLKCWNGDVFVLVLSLLNFPNARSRLTCLRIRSQAQVERRHLTVEIQSTFFIHVSLFYYDCFVRNLLHVLRIFTLTKLYT